MADDVDLATAIADRALTPSLAPARGMSARVERLPHVSPAERCICVVCDAARLAHLRTLSSSQRRALAALHRAVPRHPDDLRRTGVRWPTLASMMSGTHKRPALVLRLDLRRPMLDAPYYSFVLLTRHGADAVAARKRTGLPL